ncbi:unnamed protein product [Didymodactylos carnosus]|uniref:4-nitrophenylphosphatase n=1 Tax=Didymodactylos carnosus TaxID=1234261 RepID=A0A814FTH4_9BILA|nr:unnamed protein product [Didymodactylos carnosus]CAF0987285.1 unnamed protein product [Didymodactylos carnosus]CAF3662869.1 unnamed protein product [Didymodactylos carnosus]CAF3759447.1 unnamed protein product [Didymodactylos carnosus]
MCEQITDKNVSSLVEKHDTFIFDCDGVLWNWPHVIPGAVDLLNKLTALGKQIFFVTNNSTKTQDDYAKRFADIGFNAAKKADQVPSDLQAIKTDEVQLDSDITCVISALDLHMSYLKVLKAATHLKRKEVLFLGTNDDASLPTNDEVVMPGAGAVLAAVTAASGRLPTILGKPHTPMWKVIQDEFNLNPTKTVMVGDRLETDIAFGNNQGLTTILVLTGATNESHVNELKEQKTDKSNIPNFYISGVGKLAQLINDSK